MSTGRAGIVLKKLFGYFAGDGYQARAFRGTAFTVGGLAGQNFLRLGSNLILTRLLFPEAFGLMALVNVVLMGATMFSDLGIRGSIVQHARGHDPAFLNTAWTVQILRGVVLAGIIMALADPLARFYDAPQLGELLLVSALVPLIQGFGSTRLHTASRELQLGRLVGLQLFSQFAGIIAMILLSWWLHSVWGLVLGTLVGALVSAVLSHIVIKGDHRNRLGFEREALGNLFSFGRFVFIATIAGFFANQGDRAVLGKYVSLEDLAIYNIGYFLASMPLLLALEIGNKVVYPLYARRPPAESKHNARKINRARLALTAALVGGLIILALIGDWLIRLLYDPRYHTAGPLLVAVAIANLPVVITTTYQRMPLAFGHSGRFAIFSIGRAAILMAVLLASVPVLGVWAAAAAPGITALLAYPLLLWSIAPYKGWDPRHDMLYGLTMLVAVAALVWFHAETLTPAWDAFSDVIYTRSDAAGAPSGD